MSVDSRIYAGIVRGIQLSEVIKENKVKLKLVFEALVVCEFGAARTMKVLSNAST